MERVSTRSPVLLAATLLAATLLAAGCVDPSPSAPPPPDPAADAPALAAAGGIGRAEVWLVDQSNSPGRTFGGTLHVFDAEDPIGAADAAPRAVVDLGGDVSALCLASTGANPVRPHMLFFTSTGSHAVLAFVASGHVAFLDAATRRPVGCVRTSAGVGGARQAHAAVPSPDDRYVLVANQNGKRLERFTTDWAAGQFAAAGVLDLATCTTPSGAPCQDPALRPDNAPICPLIARSGAVAFVTLRGGGLFVVDPRTPALAIVGEYDRAAVHGNGCGGVEAGGSMFIDSGGGTASNLSEFDLYRFPLTGYGPSNPPNTPARTLVFTADDQPERDAHGVLATKDGRYVWVLDRAANLAEVFDAASGAHVGTAGLAGAASADPSPDLGDLSPSGNRIYVSLRGPNPLSGDPHVATGSTPGLGVVQVEQGGRTGVLKRVVRISNVDAGGVERADPHAIRVRRGGRAP